MAKKKLSGRRAPTTKQARASRDEAGLEGEDGMDEGAAAAADGAIDEPEPSEPRGKTAGRKRGEPREEPDAVSAHAPPARASQWGGLIPAGVVLGLIVLALVVQFLIR